MEPGPYEYERYVTTVDGLRDTVAKFGVAIIPNVLTSAECDMMMSGVWDFFEHITQKWDLPIDRENSETWTSLYELQPMHSMLFQHWGVGQAQVSWDLRQKEKLAGIFANFWQTETDRQTRGISTDDLLVSFDGLSFSTPHENTNRGYFRKNLWYHTDQSYARNDFECLQSWVTACDVREGDSTLAFLESSNSYHSAFRNKCINGAPDKTDWYKLSDVETSVYVNEFGCKPARIRCPKGSMVFWDSRTIHCGIEAMKTREKPNFRCVVYLCYMPRNGCSESNLRKKIKALTELRTTNHWPCKPKLFPKTPRAYGGKKFREITPADPPKLTELGKKLAGHSLT